MTINEALAKVDALQPNQYDFETKMSWLTQVDGEIFKDIILTHHNPPERVMRRSEFDPDMPGHLILKPYNNGDDVLIVGSPYADTVYIYWLQAQISMQNSEIAKYSQYATQYNAAYQSYANYYNRTHLPIQPHRGNRVKF